MFSCHCFLEGFYIFFCSSIVHCLYSCRDGAHVWVYAPMYISMHEVAATNLFLWADGKRKQKRKWLLEFLNKVQRDFSYKWYFVFQKNLYQKLLSFSSSFVIVKKFATGGIYAEVENSYYIALSVGTVVFHYVNNRNELLKDWVGRGGYLFLSG